MSSRDLILQQSALAGLVRSHSSQVTALQSRMSRWPGAVISIFLEPGTQFTPGTSFTRNWVDVASITVPRGVWLVTAEVAVSSRFYSGYPVFWVSLRLNSSDDASAEERTYHSGAGAGLRTDLTSFSTYSSANGGTIALQVSQCTGAPSPPVDALRPTLVSCTIIARPN